MATKKKDIHGLFQDSMKKIADTFGVTPQEVTKVMFDAEDPNNLSEWEVRKCGGFNGLKTLYFPNEMDVALKQGSRLVKQHRTKLEKQYGEEIFKSQEIVASLKDELNKATFKIHKPVPKKKPSKKSRTLVAHISDTHFGANIDPNELGGLNEFNWKIAARRMAFFAEQIVDYKPHHRKETDLVVCINGDIIAGAIHNQEWFSDLLAVQFSGTLDILTQFLSYTAQHYSSVKVYCTPGNHGRSMHKSDKGRANTHKWDSYESMIFHALKLALDGKVHNLDIEVPQSPYAIFSVQGHNFFQTHGDTIITVGNPGKSLNIKSINEQIMKLNTSAIGGSKSFEAVIVGHVHVPTIQLTDSGTTLVVNGSLSGTDPFAQSVGVFSNHPTQQFFEVTKEHAVGDMRFIKLNAADSNAKLDKIITPYTRPDAV